MLVLIKITQKYSWKSMGNVRENALYLRKAHWVAIRCAKQTGACVSVNTYQIYNIQQVQIRYIFIDKRKGERKKRRRRRRKRFRPVQQNIFFLMTLLYPFLCSGDFFFDTSIIIKRRPKMNIDQLQWPLVNTYLETKKNCYKKQ